MAEENDAGMDFTDDVQDEDDLNGEKEDSLEDCIEKVTEVLDEAADKMYELADSLEVTDKELDEIKAGDAEKTQGEIDAEDDWAAQIAAPIVDVLDEATAAIYGMAEKVLGMTEDFLNNIFSEKD